MHFYYYILHHQHHHNPSFIMFMLSFQLIFTHAKVTFCWWGECCFILINKWRTISLSIWKWKSRFHIKQVIQNTPLFVFDESFLKQHIFISQFLHNPPWNSNRIANRKVFCDMCSIGRQWHCYNSESLTTCSPFCIGFPKLGFGTQYALESC